MDPSPANTSPEYASGPAPPAPSLRLSTTGGTTPTHQATLTGQRTPRPTTDPPHEAYAQHQPSACKRDRDHPPNHCSATGPRPIHTGSVEPDEQDEAVDLHLMTAQHDAADDDVDAVILGDVGGTVPNYNPPHTPITYRRTLQRIWPTTVPSHWKGNIAYMQIYDAVRLTGLPNYIGARVPVPSGLNIPAWREKLHGYHDSLLVEYLEFGWPADYTADFPPTPAQGNHKEDPAFHRHIQEYVRREVALGALLGPFTNLPFQPWTQLSPIMTRPKKNSLSRRIIVDLSYPRGCSVNAGIRKGMYQGLPSTYTLPSIMDLADEVARLGRGCYMWCTDLSRAYRQLRACPLAAPLYGITLDGKVYIDTAPPFGCRTSSMACARTTNAVVYLLQKLGHFAKCYLDDFAGAAGTRQWAEAAYAAFKRLARELGLDLAEDKCVPPTTELEWLGFKISSIHMSITIPEDKLNEILEECGTWTRGRCASRKDLQRLVGRLQHVARCVQPARRFMARILATLRDAPHVGKHLVPEDLLLDIQWFKNYARDANGIVLIPEAPRTTWVIECDSSLQGGGAHSPTHYFAEQYDTGYTAHNPNIARLEALNLLHAVKHLLPQQPHRYDIVVNTDNMATQQVLSEGTGRDTVLSACAREIWLLAAHNNCTVQVLHKPGKDLVLADALSRYSDTPAARLRADFMCARLGLSRIRIQHSLEVLTDDL